MTFTFIVQVKAVSISCDTLYGRGSFLLAGRFTA